MAGKVALKFTNPVITGINRRYVHTKKNSGNRRKKKAIHKKEATPYKLLTATAYGFLS
jgi:hypothetical protein